MSSRSAQTLHLESSEYARYLQKLRFIHDGEEITLTDPYSFSDSWTDDVNSWPEVTFGDIYTYLIDSPGMYTKEAMKAYKSLEAWRNISFVETIYMLNCQLPVCVLKCRVKPSQRVTEKPMNHG